MAAKITFIGITLPANEEFELLPNNNKFGVNAEIVYLDDTTTNLFNLTEIHWLYPSEIREKRVAFESDIHSTGVTIDTLKIKSLAISIATAVTVAIDDRAEESDKPALAVELADVNYQVLNNQVELTEELCKGFNDSDWQATTLKGLLAFVEKVRSAVITDELVPEQYVRPEEGMRLVTWPESQLLMEHPDFESECVLVNDEYGLSKFGSSAYWAPESIVKSVFY